MPLHFTYQVKMDSPLVNYYSDDGRLTFSLMEIPRWIIWIFLAKVIIGIPLSPHLPHAHEARMFYLD